MPSIRLTTEINSNLKTCFDLARSIDLHIISSSNTKEKAIDGVTKGLINLNETVTWQAIHFGIKFKLSTTISIMEKPFKFRDEQKKGPFKILIHDHEFELVNNKVIMTDIFFFRSPFGVLGKIIDSLILEKYFRKFLILRNNYIKEYAETENWIDILNIKK